LEVKPAAIVALAIGDEHLAYWRQHAEQSWRRYAQKCGYDLIIVTQPLDGSPAGTARSAAWQKCLVLSQPFSSQYRQIISLDCDIVINAEAAPPIDQQVEPKYVGGVISGSHIHADLRAVLLARLKNIAYPYERGTQQWRDLQNEAYQWYGLTPCNGDIVQTGVLVASPEHHRGVFESIYTAVQTHDSRCYEQIPLSHALLRGGLFRQLDSRFNSVFYETLLVHYPYLQDRRMPAFEQAATFAVQAELANNFFLHFAYDRDFARFLPS
jgi:hypothetical protein